jgi:cytochrome c-type biogenesis protein CcmH
LAAGKLAGEPVAILERALKLDPRNQKALALLGGAAFERADYKAAVGYWERLLVLAKNEPELTQALETGIAQAKERMKVAVTPQKPAKLAGTVRLAPELESQVRPQDVVFIFARPVTGSAMPLAVKRIRVSDLPYDFILDETMAMNPQMKLTASSRVLVGARISRTGKARPGSGDLEGFSTEVKPGAKDIQVVIEHEIP